MGLASRCWRTLGFGDDVEEDVEFLILGGGWVVEAVVTSAGEAAVASEVLVPAGEGSGGEDFR